jgi:hypothetical protein
VQVATLVDSISETQTVLQATTQRICEPLISAKIAFQGVVNDLRPMW